MDLHLSSLGTLYWKGPAMCFMQQQGVKFTEIWHNFFFSFAGTLIWYHTHTPNTNTKTKTHSTLRGAIDLTHPYKYILTPPVVCLQQLSALQWKNNSLISKVYSPKYVFSFQNLLVEVNICWLDAVRLSSSCETNNSDRNGVNKQNTHTPNTLKKERKHWKGLVWK